MSKEEKEAKKQKKEDAEYLDSVPRFLGSVVWGIVEFVLTALIVLAITSHLESGDFSEMFTFNEETMELLRPGGFIFTALVGALPILILSNVSAYFGSGSVGRLALSVVRCFAVIIWLYVSIDALESAVDIADLVSGDIGVDYVEMSLDGIVSLLSLILVITLIVPFGEYVGARKKRREAIARKNGEASEARSAQRRPDRGHVVDAKDVRPGLGRYAAGLGGRLVAVQERELRREEPLAGRPDEHGEPSPEREVGGVEEHLHALLRGGSEAYPGIGDYHVLFYAGR